MSITHSDPDTDTKVLGGLIAKRVTRRLGGLPDTLAPQHIDDAAQDVLYNRSHPGSVETAKREASRLLIKAREMGSLTAAMEVYKRELRQLHEAEKINRARNRRLRTRAIAAVTVAAVAGLIILMLL